MRPLSFCKQITISALLFLKPRKSPVLQSCEKRQQRLTAIYRLPILEVLFRTLLEERAHARVVAKSAAVGICRQIPICRSLAPPFPTKPFGFAGTPENEGICKTPVSAYRFLKFFSERFSRNAPMPSFLSSVPQVTPKASASKAQPVAISVCIPMRMQRLDSHTAI